MAETVLIVDDEQPVRYMVQRLLEGSGYRTLEAAAGEQALEVCAQKPVDLVITDLKMPGMDGLELARQLLERDPDRPVLLMTAFGDLDSARQAVRVGIYEYFTKPVDVNDVLSGMQRALERRRLVLENRAYQEDLERKVEERTRELQKRLRELEARDRLLKQMLSIQDPQETLGLAVQLALDLCACDAGGLYLSREREGVRLRAAAGFLDDGKILTGKETEGLKLDGLEQTVRLLEKVEQENKPVLEHAPDEVRRGFGVQSFAVLPVFRGEELIAFLEVGRKDKGVKVGDVDLTSIRDFMSYVAMAVVDCKLQDELPSWEGDLEDVLKASEKWTQS